MTKCVTYLEFTWSQSITNNVYDYKPQLFLDNYCYCLKWPNTLISYYQALVTNTQCRQAIIKVNNSEKNPDVVFAVRYQRFLCFEV